MPGKRKSKGRRKLLHNPRLDTILMVEDTLRHLADQGAQPTMNQLWRALPKAVMWQTFCLIIDYLEQSGKVAISEDRKLIWVFTGAGKIKLPYEVDDYVYIG